MSSDLNKSTGKIFTSPQRINKLVAQWPSLGHYLLHKLGNDVAEATIIIDFSSSRRWTGSQVREKVLNVATALVDIYKFQPGTAVCISYDHTDLTCILAMAIIVVGGIVACCYSKDPYNELLYQARKVEPKFLFCHEKNIGWATQLEADMSYPVFGIAMGEHASEQHLQYQHFEHLLNYDHTQSCSIKHLPVACVDTQKEVAFIMMSSGTTGKPKAVPTTHWNCIAEAMGPEPKKLVGIHMGCSSSLDYISGRLIFFRAIETGYTAVLMDGFDAETYLKAIERYKIKVIYLGGASFYNLISHKDVDKYDLSSVEEIFPMGAKIIYLNELGEFLKKHPHIKNVRQGYGASEISGGAMNSMRPEEYLQNSEDCGTLSAGMRMKIVDTKTGELLGTNQKGMIHIRGDTVFPGYYDMERMRNAIKTQKCLETDKIADEVEEPTPFVRDPSTFDEDGYYISGDIAYFDDREHLHFVGRKKEIMSCRGAKKVLPQELEEVISEHRMVCKVCVLGIASKIELLLQCPRAFIVLKPDFYQENSDELSLEPITLAREKNNELAELKHEGSHKLCKLDSDKRRIISENIMQFVNERVGWEKQLTGGIVILDNIPTSRSTGKMDKNYLRALDKSCVEIYGDQSE